MQFPTYIVYELLIRLQELNPLVGDYLSFKNLQTGIYLRTTTGSIEIPEAILSMQFHDPGSIKRSEIISLLTSFQLNNPLD
ncbi:hypothetical protein [Pedobacter metabolipauper]|uniref:Uncharacterized protein n=1 Tax=Pedobacter metabolipauper TaxID=425513 RepID=A0A4V3D144_9SPHI|nr:hypothetical protein [Pedobacter metabolipauper]TDQ09217.1 hypothetical protein ATK78_1371 [Pedobacter metabolipauper]